MANYAYDKGTPRVTSFAAKTTTGAGDVFAINHLGAVEVSWERILPGTAPATQTTNLEICHGDPTVDPWYTLDSENTVTPASVRKQVSTIVTGTALRANLAVITTPGGGVTATISVRQKGV